MRLGVVVIGRNEAPRLPACLGSVTRPGIPVVYVDSGSCDDSLQVALSRGASVHPLDPATPFSAARARNEGLERLRAVSPEVELVQFVDGDCELFAGWLDDAVDELARRPEVAVVFGRVRERYPDANIYTRLCDVEFDRPPGEVAACGGIFMIRRAVFESVGGFNASVPAGEEPELCRRIRAAGGKIVRLGRDMCWHDSAMRTFRQWWRRQVRGGYGGLDVAQRFGLPQFVRQCRSARLWTVGVLAAALAAGAAAWALWSPWAALGAAAVIALSVPLQAARIGVRLAGRMSLRTALLAGGMAMVSKWGQVWGQVRWMIDKQRGRAPRVIEHRRSPTAPSRGVS